MLVERGANVHSLERALIHAAERGHYEVVTLLLSLGADNAAVDKNWFTALHSAARNGHLMAVRALLSQPQGDVNTRKWSIKPVHLAALHGHVAVVQELLERGANCDVVDELVGTPLHVAARGGHIETISLLLDHVENPHGSVGIEGKTPLHCAVESGSLRATNLLLEHGADPNVATAKEHRTPLHIAADAGDVVILKRLLECCVRVDAQLKDSKLTPFLNAAYYGHVDCLKALRRVGANIYATTGRWPYEENVADGMTAMHLAGGNVDIVKAMLEFSTEDAVLLGQDACGHTPFFYAFLNWELDSCRLLLKHAGDKKEMFLNEDVNGWKPIHVACKSGKVEFVQLLLDFGADIDIPTKEEGYTPEVSRLLVEQKANAVMAGEQEACLT